MPSIRRVAEIRQGLNTRIFDVSEGMGTAEELADELEEMTDVLLGRIAPPASNGILTLMEVADAYFSRASEMTMKIQRAEREGRITKGHELYRLRTGELRTFLEMTKRASDLGSRRLTDVMATQDKERTGRESK
ncbi:hypothetical protein PBI_CANTARE_72 [Brevibacterium phage Cantare]|uniref:Uncharacterized protein n=1 Tax=Brevibacterium phage Cantare TaxID=2338395 RepID=A0A3G3LYR8_9CAUD|nr:hypothetical protein PQD70_gp072 [Brevibacterium phage Cantare]AYQ99292.1 hypothetical protein PBI_CANTARE_72 [Brevibacterium phage Cantare]